MSAERPLRISVRMRVLATVLCLASLGMLGAGVTTVVMHRAALDDRVDASLRTEVREFREVVATGVDPVTGRRNTSVPDVLQAALQKQAPDRDETFLTLVDGRPQLVPRGERFVALEREPGLLAQVRALPGAAAVGSGEVPLREIRTSAGRVRYAAVQLADPGSPVRGTYVVAHSLARNDREVAAITERFVLVALVSLVVLAVVGWLVAGRLLRPLRSLRATADRISHTDLSERLQVNGRDDVSELAVTFNGMLDRLQAAFGTQQQFLDDAGHELRTPVTVIRGHLELLDVDDRAEVEATRTLVVDELDRMGRLVQDLTLLAKSRRPDFLRRQPVAVGELVVETLEKARGLGCRRWRLDGETDAVVSADPQRLTQALLQLADNAVKHTGPDDTVAFGCAADGQRVRLWVRDSGSGVPAGEGERIFERFARAGSSRLEGSGLGLSIVAAIAQAHGGRAGYERPADGGARFTVELPAGPTGREG